MSEAAAGEQALTPGPSPEWRGEQDSALTPGPSPEGEGSKSEGQGEALSPETAGRWCTPTRLAKYVQCPWAFYQEYGLGRKVEAGPLAALGTLGHSIMSAYLRHLVATGTGFDPSELSAIAGRAAAPPEMREMLRDWVLSAGAVPIAKIRVIDPVDGSDEAQGWWPYDLGELGELRGHPDLVMVDGTTAEVVDWKTGWRIFDPEGLQPDGYALLVFAHFPEVDTVHFRFEFLRHQARRERTYTRAEARPILGYIMGLIERIVTSTEWPATPNEFCAYCPWLCGECPAGAAALPDGPPKDEDAARNLARALALLRATIKRDELRADRMAEELQAWCDANNRAGIDLGDGNGWRFGVVRRRAWRKGCVMDLATRCGQIGMDPMRYVAIGKAADHLRDRVEFADLVEDGAAYTQFARGKAPSP